MEPLASRRRRECRSRGNAPRPVVVSRARIDADPSGCGTKAARVDELADRLQDERACTLLSTSNDRRFEEVAEPARRRPRGQSGQHRSMGLAPRRSSRHRPRAARRNRGGTARASRGRPVSPCSRRSTARAAIRSRAAARLRSAWAYDSLEVCGCLEGRADAVPGSSRDVGSQLVVVSFVRIVCNDRERSPLFGFRSPMNNNRSTSSPDGEELVFARCRTANGRRCWCPVGRAFPLWFRWLGWFADSAQRVSRALRGAFESRRSRFPERACASRYSTLTASSFNVSFPHAPAPSPVVPHSRR